MLPPLRVFSADVVVAGLLQQVGRVPGLGEARAQPAARRLAGEALDGLGGQADGLGLVVHLLHVLLDEAVAEELPLARHRRLGDLRIGLQAAAVDGQHARDAELVEHFQHAPEADAVAVLVPGPIGDVGRGLAAGRRREHRARHGLVDVPFLDVDDDPHHHARAAGQHQLGTAGDGRVAQAFMRTHRDVPSGSLSAAARRPSHGTCPGHRCAPRSRRRAPPRRRRRACRCRSGRPASDGTAATGWR